MITVQRLSPSNRRDMEDVLGIIKATSTVETWYLELRDMMRNAGGLIAVDIETAEILGVLIYSGYPYGREIQLIGVKPDRQREKIGTALVGQLQAIMDSSPHIKEITVQVPDGLLPVHLFFRACEFRAVEIVDEDKYLFVCKKLEVAQPVMKECVGV